MAQWVKPDININFYDRRKTFWALSILAIIASFATLIGNWAVRGDALNYGTDFKGGSQIQIEFHKDVGAAAIRSALNKGGFKGAEVVRLQDETRKHFYMLRLTDVSALASGDMKRVKGALQKEFENRLKDVSYKSGSDKVYLTFTRDLEVDATSKGQAVRERVAKRFAETGVAVQRVRLFGRAEDRRFEVQLRGLSEKIDKVFAQNLGKDAVKEIPQVETVGAKMGRQLRDDGLKAVIYALLLMLVYIALRFDFRYAPGAVAALAHDVTITVGLFSLTWTEFSLPVVAALLTIAGYSINDTIVVYDRIRENVARLRDRKFSLVVNSSVNETLSRTVLTSITTLFTCVAIWIVGTGVLRVFAFALVAGVVVGTYSSIFVASPLVVVLNERFAAAKRKARLKA
jgi:preprotein translocase subunit SecF